jgi:hypothetical protein
MNKSRTRDSQKNKELSSDITVYDCMLQQQVLAKAFL